MPYIATVMVKVEAEDEEAAIDRACKVSQPSALVGNGGYDKMIGVDDGDDHKCSIECGDVEASGVTVPEIICNEISEAEYEGD